jgi:hypothetical protein
MVLEIAFQTSDVDGLALTSRIRSETAEQGTHPNMTGEKLHNEQSTKRTYGVNTKRNRRVQTGDCSERRVSGDMKPP